MFFSLWKKREEVPQTTHVEAVTKFLHKYNEMFKSFLNNGSWFVYVICGLLILSCLYFYVADCKRRFNIRRRRENLQAANERLPQRRRPGAIYRDHEIFRNVIRTVRQYIGSNSKQDYYKPVAFKTTRSGLIYGSFSDNE